MMDAYDVMHEWDRATGRPPRSDEELDQQVPTMLSGADYGSWKAGLEARDVEAIKLGMRSWGLPIRHLGQFEIDDAIGTVERPDEAPEG
jgi:hypothetical protein